VIHIGWMAPSNQRTDQTSRHMVTMTTKYPPTVRRNALSQITAERGVWCSDCSLLGLSCSGAQSLLSAKSGKSESKHRILRYHRRQNKALGQNILGGVMTWRTGYVEFYHASLGEREVYVDH